MTKKTMIDTIILEISYENIEIANYQRFGVSRDELTKVRGFRKWPGNPTKEEAQEGYYPKLTLIKRPSNNTSGITLKIEFSAPKMVFGNNLEELSHLDLDRVIMALRKRLGEMGVWINIDTIKIAKVMKFHVSKNIVLEDGYTAGFVIRELGKIDVPATMDLDEKDYRNGGESLQIYSKSHSFAIYDKGKEMGLRNQILRLEFRLTDKRKATSICKKIGVKVPNILEDLFRDDLSREILSYYWDYFVGARTLFTFDVVDDPIKNLVNLLSRKNIGPKRAIYLVGLGLLCRGEGGSRTLRNSITSSSSQRTWYRVKKDLDLMPSIQPHSWHYQVKKQLAEFVPYRISGP